MSQLPSVSPAGSRRLARLQDSRLQVVVDARADLESVLTAAVEASADICRLRDDRAGEDRLRAAADTFRRVCDHAAALFVLDRFPGLALQVGADGVVVGPPDVDADHARRTVGPDLLVGRIATTVPEVDAAVDQDIDLVVLEPGPGTPREALVTHAAEAGGHPWYATVDPARVDAVLAAGATRVVVDLSTAGDPAAVCWALRRALAAHPAG